MARDARSTTCAAEDYARRVFRLPMPSVRSALSVGALVGLRQA
jgi:hypothetical protein